MKMLAAFLITANAILGLFYFAAMNPPKAEAVPSYARQTGLPCSGCHYTPPELNPAGRRFKLLGYVDRADETKVIQTDGSKKRAALDLLASLPLSAMLEASFTSLKSPEPNTTTTPTTKTQNGNFEFPQDVSLFLSGAWTSKIGSFLQVTYDTQANQFGMDNTDIRYANKTKWGRKELVYGVQLSIDETQPPSFHYEIGKRLTPLREEGILILGSGNLVHNLHAYAWGRHVPEPYDWAVSFESRVRELLLAGEYKPLVNYEHQLGSEAELAVPTPDHYLPLLYVAGTRTSSEPVTFPVEGVDGGSVSMLAVQVG
jgi:Catalytic LigB subunit of aromatic ring-opening dioxygenase